MNHPASRSPRASRVVGAAAIALAHLLPVVATCALAPMTRASAIATQSEPSTARAFGDITAELAQAPSDHGGCCGHVMPVADPDPIDPATGAFRFSERDQGIPGVAGLDYLVERYHDSGALYDGPLGKRWDSPIFRRLYDTGPGTTVAFFDGEMRKNLYVVAQHQASSTSYSTPRGSYFELRKVKGSGNQMRFELTDAAGTVETYDVQGTIGTQQWYRLTERTDPNGNRIQHQYDASGQLIRIIDTSGASAMLAYYASGANAGRVQSIVDPAGRTTQYGYDSQGNLTTVTAPATAAFPLGSTYSYSYDAQSRLASAIEPGKSSAYIGNTYDAQGRIVRQQFGAANQFSLISWSSFPWITVVDRAGCTVDYLVDPTLHEVLQKRVHDSASPNVVYTTSYQYDSEGHRSRIVAPNGGILDRVFDVTAASARSRANLLSNTHRSSSADAVGVRTSWSYVPSSNYVLSETLPEAYAVSGGSPTASMSTRYTYDSRGNALSVEFPAVAFTGSQTMRRIQFQYDALGRMIQRTDPNGVISTYAYPIGAPTPHATIEIQDPGGIARTFTRSYNAARQMTYSAATCACSGGVSETSYVLDARDQIVSLTERIDAVRTRQTVFAYDDVGNMTSRSVQDDSASGDGWSRSTWQYDLLNNIVSRTDDIDATHTSSTTYAYDAKERLRQVDEPEGVRHRYTYNERDLVTSVIRDGDLLTTADDSTYSATYDANGRLVHVTNPLGQTRTCAYDGYGRLVNATDFLQTSYTTTWNANSLPTSVAVHAGGVVLEEEHMVWNLCNELVAHEQLHHDSQGAAVGDGWVSTTCAYDVNGNLAYVTDENGATTSFGYDALGRRVSVRDSLTPASGADCQYGPNGSVSKIWAVEGNTLTGQSTTRLLAHCTDYDAAGNLLRAEDGLGQAVTFEWTLGSALKRHVDQAGRIRECSYDERGRVVAVTQRTDTPNWPSAGDVVTSYEYDGNSRLLRVRAQNAPHGAEQVTEFGYDAFGSKRWIRHADGTQESYSYDANQDLAQLVDPNGNVVSFSRDANGAPTGFTVQRAPGVQGTSYTMLQLDALGRDVRAENDDYVVTRAYDTLGHLTSEIVTAKYGGATSQVRAEYDALGRIAKLFYPKHTAQNADYAVFGMDGSDRLRAIHKQEGATLRPVLAIDYAGQRVLRESGAQRLSTFDYDAGGRPIRLIHGSGARMVSRFDIARDPTGGVQQIMRRHFDSSGAQTAPQMLDGGIRNGYDGGDRLIASFSGLTQQNLDGGSYFSAPLIQATHYDRLGNRVSSDYLLSGTQYVPGTYSSNDVNEYTFSAGVAQTFDANGNVKSSGPSIQYTYDYRNRPVAIDEGGTHVEIDYDPYGRRVLTTSNALTQSERLVYWDWSPIEQTVGLGLAVGAREFLYGRGLDEAVEMRDLTTSKVYSYFLDQWGSPTELVDETGATTASYRYLDYGRRFHADPASGDLLPDPDWFGVQPIGFQGRWLIAGGENRLDFRNRMYLPWEGRFAQPDPLGFPDGWMNRYHFAHGNPNGKDPFGLNEPGELTDGPEKRTHVGETKAASIAMKLDAQTTKYAVYSNWAQDNSSNSAMSVINVFRGMSNNWKYHALGSAETREKWAKWHWDRMVENCNGSDLGDALHFAQDLVYHLDKNNNPYNRFEGHALEEGASVVLKGLGWVAGVLGTPGAKLLGVEASTGEIASAMADSAGALVYNTDHPPGELGDEPDYADLRNKASIEISKLWIGEWMKRCGWDGKDKANHHYQGGKPKRQITPPLGDGPPQPRRKPYRRGSGGARKKPAGDATTPGGAGTDPGTPQPGGNGTGTGRPGSPTGTQGATTQPTKGSDKALGTGQKK